MRKTPLLYIKIASGILAFVLALVVLVFVLALRDDGSGLRLYDVKPDEPESESSPLMGIINPDSEMRGLWIATVQNINFPSKKGLTRTELRAEMDDIIATAKEDGFNAIFFQVRPCADALYASDIFPLTKYVTGKQKMYEEGDFDILAYLLERAHENNIRVHAWVNPLRVTAGSASYPDLDLSRLSDGHPAKENPDWVHPYADGKLYFDAGIPEVRELVAAGVREIVEKYDVDGVVFDDYFYPYPVYTDANGRNVKVVFDDNETYEKYGGEYSNLGDFRRASINDMIKKCYEAVKERDPDCLFGVAPFGIWQNDNGKNGGSATGGLSSYSAIYCDPLAWVRGGYIDYLAPQIYWRFSTQVAPYGTLVDWWNAVLDGSGVDLYIAHAAYLYDSWEEIDSEMTRQIDYARERLCYKGSVLYGYAAIKNDSAGIAGELKAAFSDNIIYTDATSNGAGFAITSHESGQTVNDNVVTVSGVSDPYYPLKMGGANISRKKNGDFSLYLPLSKGENTFTFTAGEKEYVFKIIRK